MEEKKNSKGLIIGIIIFLIICLILIFYFMFKMVYKEPSTNTNSNEASNAETNNSDSFVFTELNKYELKEGEEKEVTVDGKKIILKRENSKIYLNSKELQGNGYNIYITDKLLFVSVPSQNISYNVYDLDGNLIENSLDEYLNLRLENGKLLFEKRNFDQASEGIIIAGKTIIASGGPVSTDNPLSKNPDFIKEHENDVLYTTYEILYKNNKMIVEYVKVSMTFKDYFNGNYDNWFFAN